MRSRWKKESGQEKPFSDADRQAIRRVLSTPDGKALLDFLKAKGGVDVPTYRKGTSHEEMIHHGARKALVCEVLDILKA